MVSHFIWREVQAVQEHRTMSFIIHLIAFGMYIVREKCSTGNAQLCVSTTKRCEDRFDTLDILALTRISLRTLQSKTGRTSRQTPLLPISHHIPLLKNILGVFLTSELAKGIQP